MLLSEPLAFFKTILLKFYLNSQRMSDSFYLITELSELNWKIKVSKTYSFGHVLEFLRRMTSWCKRMCSAIYDVIKSNLTRV